jgi:hypothetical protein
MTFCKVLLFAFILSRFSCFPLFKQCDDRWGNQTLGTGNTTICKEGCLMSSISMMLHGCGISIEGAEANPSTVNVWLAENHGFVSNNIYMWKSIEPMGFSYYGRLKDAPEIKDKFSQGMGVFLNVNKGGHFVLMTGFDSQGYKVNDPGPLPKDYYTNEEVVRADMYMLPGDCSVPKMA